MSSEQRHKAGQSRSVGIALVQVPPGHFAQCPSLPPQFPRLRTDHVHANERRHVSVNKGHVYVNEAVTCALICARRGGKGFPGKVRTDPAAFGLSRGAAPPVPVPCVAPGDCPLGKGTGDGDCPLSSTARPRRPRSQRVPFGFSRFVFSCAGFWVCAGFSAALPKHRSPSCKRSGRVIRRPFRLGTAPAARPRLAPVAGPGTVTQWLPRCPRGCEGSAPFAPCDYQFKTFPVPSLFPLL